jgi:hypothetical protein
VEDCRERRSAGITAASKNQFAGTGAHVQTHEGDSRSNAAPDDCDRRAEPLLAHERRSNSKLVQNWIKAAQ